MTVSIAVLGLNRPGISAAAILSGKHKDIHCKGWDTDTDRLVAADRSKAFKKLSRKLNEVAVDADLILITLPPHSFKEILPELKEIVRPGTILVSFSAAHVLPAQWVREALGDLVRFVAMLPAYNPALIARNIDELEESASDLFTDGVMYISLYRRPMRPCSIWLRT
jgi:prephenate dehydrogenase